MKRSTCMAVLLPVRVVLTGLTVLTVLTMPALAEETQSLDEMAEAFGWDFENGKVTAETLGDGFHVLFGVGGNIAVSIGQDGTMLVDDQFPRMMDRIDDALAALGSKGVDFAVNTHWHFDHAGGNKHFGEQGALIVAHDNVRQRMSTKQFSAFLTSEVQP